MTEIHVDPRRSMVDEPISIQLTGLQPGERVTLRAAQTDDLQRTWRAHATFLADAHGKVSVPERAPLAGTYADADAMGLIWSMALTADEPNQSPFFRSEPTPMHIQFVAELDDVP